MTKAFRMTGAVMLVVGLGLLFGMTQTSAQSDNGQSEIQRGLSIAPVPLNLKDNKRGLVGLGSYYVNGVSDCVGCHSGASGHLGGGNPFGPVLSRNLTPNIAGLPGGLTLEQFIFTMRNGTDLKNLTPVTPGPVVDKLQIMPWPQYQKLTTEDLRAIYEYLRAIPCVPGGPGLSADRCGS